MAVRTRTLLVVFRGEARDLKRTIDSISKAETPLQKLDRAGKAAFTVLAGGAAAAAVGIGFAAKAFGDFDAALNESIAIMGEVSDMQRGEMADAAREIATQTTFSAEQAAGAFYFLASAGYNAEQSIAALPQVAQFAQAGMMDLETATDLLTTSQSAMGLSTEDAGQNLINMTRITDVLTQANNLAEGSVQQFAEALTNKAAGALRDTHVELEQGVAVLAAFAKKGVQGQVAGEKLAIFLRDTTRAAVRNREEFAKFNIEIFDQQGELKNLADVVAEFEQGLGPLSTSERAAALESLGMTRAVGDIIRTLMGSSEQIRIFEAELKGAGGTTEEVADKQLQTFNNQLTLLKNKLMDVVIEIGSHVVPHLMRFMEWFSARLPGAIEYFKEIWRSIEPTLKGVVDFIDANIMPVLETLAKWFRDHPGAVVALGAVILGILMALALGFIAFRVVALAQMAMVGAKLVWLAAKFLFLAARAAIAWLIALGPIALVIIAVIALVAVIYYFRDEVVAALSAAWEWIKEKALAFFEWFKQHWLTLLFFLIPPLAIAIAIIMTQWDHFYAFFEHIFHIMKEVVEDFWFFLQGVWNVIVVISVWIWHRVYAVVSWVVGQIMARTEGMRKWIGNKWDWIKEKAGDAWDWIKEKAGDAWDWIKEQTGNAVDWIIGKIERFKEAFSEIPGAGVLGDIVGAITGNQGGGMISKYAAGGIAGDTVPAMLTPGEMVLNRRQQWTLFNMLDRSGYGGQRGGDGGGTYVTEVHVAGSVLSEQDLVNLLNKLGRGGRGLNT